MFAFAPLGLSFCKLIIQYSKLDILLFKFPIINIQRTLPSNRVVPKVPFRGFRGFISLQGARGF